MRQRSIQGLTLLAAMALTGCPGFIGPGALTVTIQGKFQSVSANSAPIPLTASVKNDGSTNSGVSWSLTVNGQTCAPTCGTVSLVNPSGFAVIYTAPKVLPQGALTNPTITATSDTDGSKSDSFSFYITTAVPIVVTLRSTFQNIAAGSAALQIGAQVANDPSNKGVTWALTVNGATCAPLCGGLVPFPAPSFGATYTPPASVTSGADSVPAITATSVDDVTKSASFSFTITPGSSGGGGGGGQNLSLLAGQFAFLLRGFDSTGAPAGMAGSFVADGLGNITGGEIDVNVDTAITPTLVGALGKYTLDTTFNDIPRGAITISSPVFPTAVGGGPAVFRFVLSADGTRGNLVEFDGSGDQMTGFFAKQDASAFSASGIAATFAFGVDSDAPTGTRVAQAGEFALSSAGAVTSGLADESQAQAAAPIFSAAAVSGGFSAAPDPFGRAALTLASGVQSTIYAAYIVNANEIFLLEDDSGGQLGTLFAGVARAQLSINADSVNGTGVLQMTGIDFPLGTNTGGPSTVAGVMTISGGNTFNLVFDINDLGSISAPELTVSGSVIFDSTTGRATISIPGGFADGFLGSAVFYLSGAGQGFIVDADPSSNAGITNEALSGIVTPQTAGPFAPFTLLGNSIVRAGGTVASADPSFIAAVNVGVSGASFTGIADAYSSAAAGTQPDLPFDGSFTLTDTVVGRGTATVAASLFGDFTTDIAYPAIFYIIGPNQIVLIGAQTGVYSGVVNFDPQ